MSTDLLESLGILVVDDQIDHLELMREILVNAGYQSVLTADNGQDALEILDSQSGIGLVLLDLVMPGIDGYGICRRIKSTNVTQDISVIVVTGGALQVEAALSKSFEAGATDFISKPLNQFDLLARCKSALSLYLDKQRSKSHQRQLLEREETYRSIFESSIDAIFVLDPVDLMVRDINPAAELLFGYEKDSLVGRSFTVLSPRQAIPEEYQRVELLNRGEGLAMESRMLTQSGTVFTAEVKFSGYLFQGESRIMAVVSDVSSRRRAVEELRTNEERLALAVTDSGSGIWDWDIGTGDLYLSSNWAEFLGLKNTRSTDGLGTWKKHIHGEDFERILESMRAHWNNHTGYFMEEHRLIGKSGKARWVLNRGKAVWNRSGEVIRMAGSITDLSDKKRLESKMVQVRKMEGLDRFASGLARDLENMAMVVNSNCRFIEDAVSGNAEILKYLTAIRQSADHSGLLVKQLMAFGKQGHQVQLEYVFLNLEIENLLKMVKGILGNETELETEFDEGLPPVLLDHTMISQLLLNLVLNSRDAMPVGGTLKLSTSLYHLEEPFAFDDRNLPPGEYLRLSVADTGSGMEEEVLKQIFEPFFTTKFGDTAFGGSGLGLSAVYEIMKQHGGWVSVKSRPSIGTRFDLYFPALLEAEELSLVR